MEENLILNVHSHPIPGVNEVGLLRVQKASQPMNMERHRDSFELLYLQSGEKRLTVEAQSYLLHGGDLLIIRPNEVHGELDAVQNRSSLGYILLSNPESTPDFLHLSDAQARTLTNRLTELRLIHTDSETRRILNQITACFEANREADDFLQPRFTALMLLLADALIHRCHDADIAVPEDIRRILEYIDGHPAEMFNVQQLAEVLGLSEIRFKQKFKQYTGIPPAEYVARVHIRLAEERLIETRDRITDIAMDLGFSSSQHLSRLFKRYNGCSPTSYRRNQQR